MVWHNTTPVAALHIGNEAVSLVISCRSFHAELNVHGVQGYEALKSTLYAVDLLGVVVLFGPGSRIDALCTSDRVDFAAAIVRVLVEFQPGPVLVRTTVADLVLDCDIGQFELQRSTSVAV